MKEILSYDGNVYYLPSISSELESQEIYNLLLAQISWQNDEVVFFGKIMTTKRQVAWYADDNLTYSYSGSKKCL